jgi:hypothetical protein
VPFTPISTAVEVLKVTPSGIQVRNPDLEALPNRKGVHLVEDAPDDVFDEGVGLGVLRLNPVIHQLSNVAAVIQLRVLFSQHVNQLVQVLPGGGLSPAATEEPSQETAEAATHQELTQKR